MKNTKIHSLFPSEVLQKRVLPAGHSLNKHLLKECYRFSEIDEAGLKWSKKNYPGGYTSYGSISQLYLVSPYFEELKEKIDESIPSYLKHLKWNCRSRDIQMCSLWVNIMPRGTTHTMHIHPLAVLSGTYYLQVPKGTRGLKFEDPRLTSFMARPPIKTNAHSRQPFIEMEPKAGEVLLFESFMRHEVPPNPTKQDRISISFNYHWV